MTQDNNVNVNLLDSQIHELKSKTKNETGVTQRLSYIETNFQHKLLLTTTQVRNLCQDFANNLLDNIKLLKTQISKIIELSEFFGRLLSPLMKVGLQLIINVFQSLA